MDNGTGFNGNPHNIPQLDPQNFNLDFDYGRAQPSGSGGMVDPSLTTTSMSPFAAHASGAASQFLTPPTTAPSPRGTSDYFDSEFNSSTAILSALSDDDQNALFWLNRPTQTPFASSGATFTGIRTENLPGTPPLMTNEELTLATSSRTRRRNNAPGGNNNNNNSNNSNSSSNRRSAGGARRRGALPPSKTEAQRNKSLERNRIAASKCRAKKKEWVKELEETKNEIERKRAALRIERHELQEEITRLKNLLMMHAPCNDPNIKLWIQREALSFVARSGDSQRRRSTLATASSSGSQGVTGAASATASASAPDSGSSSRMGSSSVSVSGVSLDAPHASDERLGSVGELSSLTGLGYGNEASSGIVQSPVSGFGSGSGFDPGSGFGSASASGAGSGALPSPTQSPMQGHASQFSSMPINLNYMPDDLLSGNMPET